MKRWYSRKRVALFVTLTLLFLTVYYVYRRARHRPNDVPTLKLSGREFWMRGRPMRILSGSIHYFRVPDKYWEDRLQKAKAMGLNTVTTYIPWNIHEPSPGVYNFNEMYDVIKFIKEAQKSELNVIVRPGPYICAEWDWGGLPSWLLRDNKMRVRSTYPPFLAAVDRYFDKLLPMLARLQANRGGPIIAFQIENEYGSYGNDVEYMKYLYRGFRRRGIHELLITSENIDGYLNVPSPSADVLPTINGADIPDKFINKYIANMNPEHPLMVTEFWVGWFTSWGEEKKGRRDAHEMTAILSKLLEKGFSINIYMFHGGTNFGFTNGALHFEHYSTDVTSYDYDAPLTENGDVTEKYRLFRKVLSGYTFGRNLPAIRENIPTAGYGRASMHLYLPLLDTIVYLPYPGKAAELLSMEQLPVNRNTGQRVGYVLYRTRAKKESTKLTIQNCFENQTGVVIVNKHPLHELSNYNQLTITLPAVDTDEYIVDILYEGTGRVNYGERLDYQRQGLIGPVSIDGDRELIWRIYAVEFLPSFLSAAEAGGIWRRMPVKERIPMLVKGTIEIKGIPKDTFADMSNWGKGVLFVNQVNLGRYWKAGPQRTLYVPSSVLRMGINEIMIFETEIPSDSTDLPVINFVGRPIL